MHPIQGFVKHWKWPSASPNLGQVSRTAFCPRICVTLKAAKFDKCLLIGIKGNFKIDNFAKKKFDELVSQIPANFSKVLNDSTRHVVLVSKHMSLFHCSETDN
mmetsp:Transcript_6221/g.14369  ORF Transcript_6221/g.14369 Transcript_6221/m.14369 type:complete len:103 (+) Transcript_6221:296-604(+)